MANSIAAEMQEKSKYNWPEGLPLLYEDEEESEMGDANLHSLDDHIVLYGLKAFVREYHPGMEVYTNLNLYYHDGPPHERTGAKPCIAPDIMVVEPPQPLPRGLTSYTVGEDGPAPRVALEVLSPGTAEDRDLTDKPKIFSFLGVAEYILVDPTGDILPERLLLKRLQPDGTWKDERDADGGVTSQLGFRIIIDEDGDFRVVDLRSGKSYVRPEEGQAERDGRLAAEERIRELEAELQRLRDEKYQK